MQIALEELVTVCVGDYGGQLRGIALEASSAAKGVRWPGDALSLNAFDDFVALPWSNRQDLILKPDPEFRVVLGGAGDEPPEIIQFSDLFTSEGKPWEGCPRQILRAAVDDLYREFGLEFRCAFLHDVTLGQVGGTRPPLSFGGFRVDGLVGDEQIPRHIGAALRASPVRLESVGTGASPNQFRINCKPEDAIKAGDGALALRFIARAVARRLGRVATFTPLPGKRLAPNAMQLRFGLFDEGDQMNHDSTRPGDVSLALGRFLNGLLHHLPALSALSMPSPLSLAALGARRPLPVKNSFGEAGSISAIALSPGAEDGALAAVLRGADATASPHLLLAGVIRAGLQGLRDEVDLDLEEASGFDALPKGAEAALDALERDTEVEGWLPPEILKGYIALRRSELQHAESLSPEDLIELASKAY